MNQCPECKAKILWALADPEQMEGVDMELGNVVVAECLLGKESCPRCGGTTAKEAFRTRILIYIHRDIVREVVEVGSKKSVLVAVILFCGMMTSSLLLLPETASATTRYVGGAGAGNHTTIQGAVDAASPGDTVFVYKGVYRENLVIDKTISLVGEETQFTTIDGEKITSVIYVTATWVNITGFTIVDSKWYWGLAGVTLSYADHCYIANNTITDNDYGIYLRNSDYCTIENNSVSWNNESGIFLVASTYTTLTNNEMVGDGIRVAGASEESWDTHSIDMSNTVNGRPVYYIKNTNGGTVPPGVGQVIIGDCLHITVENQNLSGGSVGISIGYSYGGVVLNNTISRNNAYGLHIYESTDVSIDGNEISHNRFHGVYLENSRDNVLANNTLTEDGISMWGGIWHWDSHTIDISNTVNGKPVYYWVDIANSSVPANAGQVILVSCDGITVENQNLSHTSTGVAAAFSSRIHVANSTTSWNSWRGIDLYHAPESSVLNNTASYNQRDGIYLYYTETSGVSRNTVIGNGFFGVAVWHSPGSSVTENDVFDHWQQSMLIADSAGSLVSRNNASRNSRGLVLRSSDSFATNNTALSNGQGICVIGARSTVRDNYIANSSRTGILVLWRSSSLISNNTIIGSQRDGMELIDTEHNHIVDNLISSSGRFGIQINRTGTNFFYHNRIVNNSQQVYDVENWNIWDNGYPSGGNYWSDYTGEDLYSGPDQTEPGSDGIGDTPYEVNNESFDRYPLMSVERPPSSPLSLWARPGDGEVSLSWMSPWFRGRPPLTNYRIYRGLSPGGETFLEEVGDVTEYTDIAVVNGQRYYYQVSAKNAVGEGPKSNEASALPLPEIGGPSNVSAILLGVNHENVVLTWHLSPDDPAGFVERYAILRASIYDPSATGYQVIASVPNGTSQFTDVLAGEGDSKDYFYAVCSVDLNGKYVCARSQAAKFTRPLAKGPNLVSIPLIQVIESVDRVLQTVEYDMVWAHDAASREWRSYAEGRTYRTLDEMNHMTGIWVNVTSDCNLTMAGIVPTATTIQLQAGWNLVSFPSFNTTYTVADLKAETGATRVEGYDLSPPYFLRVLTGGEALQAGYGYWVKVDAPVVWVVGNG